MRGPVIIASLVAVPNKSFGQNFLVLHYVLGPFSRNVVLSQNTIGPSEFVPRFPVHDEWILS